MSFNDWLKANAFQTRIQANFLVFLNNKMNIKICIVALFLLVVLSFQTSAQVSSQIPTAILVKIVKAEDELRFDRDLEGLLADKNDMIRKRAVLAAGRIGNENAVAPLTEILASDSVADVRAMAAFALGEIESAKGADAILKVLQNEKEISDVHARAVEAAGKIAAANPKDVNYEKLGEAILDTLETERNSPKRDKLTVLLGITAALRAKPKDADFVLAKFLTDLDGRIRADSANSIARLRTKNANINAQFQQMLLSDDDPNARANAARGLGAGEDKTAIDLLISAATEDDDSRVRVNAIRALGSFKDAQIVLNVANSLIERGEFLLKNFRSNKSELLEIVSSLGNLLEKSENQKAVDFLLKLRVKDEYQSGETEIALAKIVPLKYFEIANVPLSYKPKIGKVSYLVSSLAQGIGEMAKFSMDEKSKSNAEKASDILSEYLKTPRSPENEILNAIPDILNAYSKFKPNDLAPVSHKYLQNKDEQIRAASASVLSELPPSDENEKSLEEALIYSLKFDVKTNDATLAILDALGKQKNAKTSKSIQLALDSRDILVRRKAVSVLKTLGIDASVKIGTVTNSVFKDANYLRAVSRKNGSVEAVLTTEKGTFTIDLFPEDAPLTVDNFIKLAKSNYFNGLTVHRVVPNFVMQDGDPRGDGNGSPGWSIRCEINMIPYERGAVGMALSGKDTGGSQWFATHSPQPHLDGGYTVFGKINETDMKIVDQIARGDKIINVKIIEGNSSLTIPKKHRSRK